MEYTKKKGYKLPNLTDRVSVESYNENFKSMDTDMAQMLADVATSKKESHAALEQIEAAGGKIATAETLGVSKPDGTTITIGADGTMTATAEIAVNDSVSTSPEKSTIQSVINVIGSTINSVKTSISDISTKVNNLTTNLATLANDHDALKTDFNAKIKLLTTSYSKYYPITLLPNVRYSDLGVDPDTNVYFKAYLQWIVKYAELQTCDVGIGCANPNSAGIVLLHIYQISDYNNTGLPQYCDGFFYNLSRSSLDYFGTNNGVYYFHSS